MSKDWKKDRKRSLKQCRINCLPQNLERKFGAKTLSMDQTQHLACVMCEIFGRHILEDPCIVLDKKLYKDAYLIGTLLNILYQNIGAKTDYTGSEQKKEVLGEFEKWAQETGDKGDFIDIDHLRPLIKEYLDKDR